MLEIEIPTMDEKKENFNKRKLGIVLILVLFTGIYGIHQTEEMLVFLGWIAIVLSSILFFTLYIVPVIYWKMFEIWAKSQKKSRKLHYKLPQYLKDRDLDTSENMDVNETEEEKATSFNLTDVERLYDAYEELCEYIMHSTPTGCNDCPRRRICMGWEGHLMQESFDKIKKFVKEE